MSGDEADLPEEGLSLWLTDWKIPTGIPWAGRRLAALVGQAVAGHLDVHVHPDGQAVKVWMLNVQPDFQRRGVASLLMDTLYEVYPTAWINHGARTAEGTWWWNSYRDPAPRRNIHNRPPAEWAVYFDAVEVASEKAQNAHLNAFYLLDGHRQDVYRYGERLEQEADGYARHYVPVQDVGWTRSDGSCTARHGCSCRLFCTPMSTTIPRTPQDGARPFWSTSGTATCRAPTGTAPSRRPSRTPTTRRSSRTRSPRGPPPTWCSR
ncbi:GNAT family N-acetyltransferase [Streptomyces sp. NPDC018693]|uniref:GNAT family N-acetyltransferase n=1 Tax=unclassified Streptomyces TaxID=2593676 RepID=UPI00378A23E3